MPELGGKRFAGNFSGTIGTLRSTVEKAIGEARARIDGASSELVAAIQTGAEKIERSIQAETAAVQRGYADMLGNDPPADPPTQRPEGSGG